MIPGGQMNLARYSSFYVVIPVLLLTLVLALMLAANMRRRGGMTRSETALLILLLVGYVAVYTVLTFLIRRPTRRPQITLQPLWSYREAFSPEGGLHIVRLSIARQILLNILVYMPLGFLLPVAFRRWHPCLLSVLAAVSLSVLTEALQLLTHRGLCELDDLIDNTVGFLLGMLILRLCLRRRFKDMARIDRPDGGKIMQSQNSRFKNLLMGFARDIWIVFLDILAVNFSYFLALILRFYVNGEFRGSVEYYMTYFVWYAPIYTVLCIVIFILFKLYGGMWKYAGINDMNRIILANVCTVLVQAGGSMLMLSLIPNAKCTRMPFTYYTVGAVLQFGFIVLIRFAYRLVLVERRKLVSRKLPAVNVMVVGTGETSRRVISLLNDSIYRPVCVLDVSSAAEGKSMDGIPILGGTDRMDHAIGEYAVSMIAMADPKLSDEAKAGIRRICEQQGLDLQDYTGFMANLSGRLPLTALLELASGPVTIRMDGQDSNYESGIEALRSMNDRFTVVGVHAEQDRLLIELKQSRSEAYVGYEAWLKKHQEETGEEISYF